MDKLVESYSDHVAIGFTHPEARDAALLLHYPGYTWAEVSFITFLASVW